MPISFQRWMADLVILAGHDATAPSACLTPHSKEIGR
jgi:hypothetical protein